ncbi:hypothetical protein TeGR_g4651 [Tetraparma gracilis]|uniref:RNA exonuclease 4 n=1 Tax=Tetraparma gracilis TaxID=2962635 RepID=A0ABQ6MUF1_9STRA|nr:hypothetical protein TeGR_g4651 [Tetraparma gracilis]
MFFSKKSKKAMLARKKKASSKPAAPAPAPEIKLTAPTPAPAPEPALKVLGRFAPPPPTSNFSRILPRTVTVKVPKDLRGAELRTFRKKARRDARAGNKDAVVRFDDQEGEDPAAASRGGGRKFAKISELVRAAEEEKAAVSKGEKLAREGEKERERERRRYEAALPGEGERGNYVALDCEMVGVGAGGRKSALARVSVVGFGGEVLMDKHVEVAERVTDFRTFVSGVRAKDLKGGGEVGVVTLKQAQREVHELLRGKVLVGHALSNDFKALMMDHPKHMIRDTARYPPFMRKGGRNGGKLKPRKLRDLVKEVLKVEDFQKAGAAHDSTTDAARTMDLYKAVRGDWEREAEKKARQAEKGRRKGGASGEKCWKSGGVEGFVGGGGEEEGGEMDDAFDGVDSD